MSNNQMYKSGVLIILGILLFSCSKPVTSSEQPTPNEQLQIPASTSPASSLRQSIPISAKAIMAGQEIQLEVARTPQQQEIGLMNRKSLAANRGMLFLFEQPQSVNFWMKNTLIPLDIVFLRNGVVMTIAPNVPACTFLDPCPTYGSRTPIDQVIELRGGRVTELGLKVGDAVGGCFQHHVKIQQLNTQTNLNFSLG